MRGSLILMALAVPALAQAQDCPVGITMSGAGRVSPAVIVRAKTVASGIFAEIGVAIDWSGKAAHCAEPIEMLLESAAGPADRPDSLAYSVLGARGGVRIHILLDRIRATVPAPASATGSLLGHVFAHEIAHVLEGVPRHSDTGVMKAAWQPADLRAMSGHPLRFALVDDALIHAALARPGAVETLAPAND